MATDSPSAIPSLESEPDTEPDTFMLRLISATKRLKLAVNDIEHTPKGPKEVQ